MRSVFRIAWLFLLSGLTVTAGFARLTSQAAQEVQVIEMTAKKYEYSPSPLRVKRGTKVQLRITALDRTHGFKINLSAVTASSWKREFRPWWNLWRAHREPTRSTAAIVAESATAE